VQNIETPKRGGTRPGAGRPAGARSTVASPFVTRLRSHLGVSQAELAMSLGVREKTVWRYEKEGIVPVSGKVREELERMGALHGIALEVVPEVEGAA
jgi:hypothetical protein